MLPGKPPAEVGLLRPGPTTTSAFQNRSKHTHRCSERRPQQFLRIAGDYEGSSSPRWGPNPAPASSDPTRFQMKMKKTFDIYLDLPQAPVHLLSCRGTQPRIYSNL